MQRGCFGGCSFCTISAHQGKFIASRSEKSIMKEVEQITKAPDFKGYISNVASVNFAKNGTYPVNADGTLTIHGVAKKVAAPGTITVNNGKVAIKTLFKIKLKDFITGSYIGSQIAEEAAITVNCEYQ